MKPALRFGAALALCALAASAAAQKGQTVKIAMIEGFSGPFANVGTNLQKSFQFLAANLNAAENPAGVKFEIVPMDSKSSPQEAINLLKSATDQGIRYVSQGNGSNVAVPLSDAVSKFNERNPGKEVIYLNYAAVDPILTNDKCSYWHFRLDADTSMKMEALTTFMKGQAQISKVYLLNQTYSHGQQASKYFKEALSRKPPDLKMVGEDYVPLGQVKDFAPYIAKIKDSGANAIVTGNWGQDMTLFMKAMADAGLKVPVYAYYAWVSGTPTALAASGDKLELYQVAYNHANYTGRMGELGAKYKAQTGDDFYFYSIYNGLVALSHAMAKAKSTDPVKVAAALEGVRIEGFNGESTMRKTDHQLQQGVWISKWQKVDAKNKYNVENTGYTFAPLEYIDAYKASTLTSCQMKRPG